MRVRFLRDWNQVYQKGSTAEVCADEITPGMFVSLQHRGIVEVVDEEPELYRTAVAVAPPKRKRGRPRKVM